MHTHKNNTPSTKNRLRTLLIVVLTLIAGFFIFQSVTQLQKSQDTRKDARIPGDPGSITFVPLYATSVGNPFFVEILASTGEFTTTGVQLSILVQTQNDEIPSLVPLSAGSLRFVHTRIEQLTTNQYQVEFIAIPENSTQGFNTNNTQVAIARIDLTPTVAGEVTFSLLQDKSKMFAYGSIGNLNLLRQMEPSSFFVSNSSENTEPSPEPTLLPRPTFKPIDPPSPHMRPGDPIVLPPPTTQQE